MPQQIGISIIIPTYNEADTIKVLLKRIHSLKIDSKLEVILVDAQESNDNLRSATADYNLRYLKSKYTSRAIQLNEGARLAKHDILYFVHADVIIPEDFKDRIIASIENGNHFGYFAYRFNSKKILLKINSYFSKFKGFYTGGGDQTFFILKSVFEDQNGFNKTMKICEDFELFDRLKKKYSFEIINSKVIVSDRKYKNANYFKVNLINLYILRKFRSGKDTEELKRIYNKLLT